MKELADYLNLLDGNESLYRQYFWWNQFYTTETDINNSQVNTEFPCCLSVRLTEAIRNAFFCQDIPS